MKKIIRYVLNLYREKKKREALLKNPNLKIKFKKSTSLILNCMGFLTKNGKEVLTWNSVELVTKEKTGDYKNFFKKVYEESRAKKISPHKYLDELAEINNLKRIAISSKNNALIDSKGFYRVFGDDLIEKYQKLIKYPKRNELIEKSKKALKNDSKKKHLKYNNKDTPEVPYSDFGTSPTFKGMKAYLKNGKFGNGIVPKGAEKLVGDMKQLVIKHQGEIRTYVTGDRPSDFKNCWRAMGVTDEKLINKYESLRKKLKLTWHHLDDLDDSLKSTFQLVDRELHELTTKHMGSHAQLLEVYKQLK
ncbi:HNH endonuclease [Tenacibaculum tangerinum]|uniref:HNH endonuclease n=1 Tax=Tenacibaculum tangerinum TaxID=3038772 RepID=A0ABY8L0Z1_9FLAO|nr:HNH endonuclease [Tenacibaculum tangerinum]WGH74761.1 HNH endonuclease [Tenacibaculum tangerinum]